MGELPVISAVAARRPFRDIDDGRMSTPVIHLLATLRTGQIEELEIAELVR